MTITCTAFRSDDTVGFLAALGIVELCTTTLQLPARLGWNGAGGAALLDVPTIASVEELSARLQGVALSMSDSNRVLPCPDPGPVRQPGSGSARWDPARLTPEEAITCFASARSNEIDAALHDRDSARWLAAIVNQLTDARSSPGTRALTPLYSPSGKMSLHQLYRDHLVQVVGDPELLRQALTRWRRAPGTGANLDTRALVDGVATSSGDAENAAVPGATWLALMSVPFFRQASGRVPAAVGWTSQPAGGTQLRWPVWRPLLDRAAIEVLLSHPAVAGSTQRRPPRAGHVDNTDADETSELRAQGRQLQALGVEAICRSARRPLGNSAGALLPPEVIAAPRTPNRQSGRNERERSRA